ncbi:hypothetical protein ACFQER_08790 [Halomicroarcula sp. GCM10025894]
MGTESEVLTNYGDVVRVGIAPRDTNESLPIKADAHLDVPDKDWYFPISDDVTFDLGVFHPVCSKWADTTSISGDPDAHENMIPSARNLAEEFCDHHVIENVPRAPLNDPVVLNGRMFGLPIEYERAFETSFRVPQPPRHERFWTDSGSDKTAETSSFFFSERSKRWWASAKHYSPKPYPKQHLAKNCIPAPYIHHVCRAWLKVYEEEHGIDEGRVDYSNYDEEMDLKRKRANNRTLEEF